MQDLKLPTHRLIYSATLNVPLNAQLAASVTVTWANSHIKKKLYHIFFQFFQILLEIYQKIKILQDF